MRVGTASSLKLALGIALVSSSVNESLRAQSIWAGPLGGSVMWMDPNNWSPNTMIPSGIDAEVLFESNLSSALNLDFGSQLTLGRITLGDTQTTYYRTTLGVDGSTLVFDVSEGNAILALGTSANNVRDHVRSNVVLNDNLEVRSGGTSGSGLDIYGTISGAGGLIRSNLPGLTPGGSSSVLKLHSRNSSYTGDTVIEIGSIEFFGSVLKNQNSALGNSSSAIVVGNANSPTSLSLYSTGANLIMRASNDSENYEIARDIDFSQSGLSSNTNQYRVGLVFGTDGAGGRNTNQLVVSGDIVLGSRTSVITVERQGMEVYITGDIRTNGYGRTAQPLMMNTVGAGSNSDGVYGGTVRFSDRLRTYTNANNLTNGTIIIEGNVGAEGTASPIGTRSIIMSDGNGGNIMTSMHGVRSLFMANADTSIDRSISLGTGNSTTPSGAGATYYGNGPINVYNGFIIGGQNTSGVVTYLGSITSSNPTVGANKRITLGQNVALISETGGTVDFKGVISDSSTVDANTRITVNQFRHHSQLDTNADGVLNAEANQAVGAATQGTVRLYAANTYEGGTEVMGGSLLVRNSSGSATGTGMILVNAGTRFGGAGSVAPGSNQLILAQGATLTPGDPTLDGGLGALRVEGDVKLNAAGGSILNFQIAAQNGINGTVASNWDGSALNWSAILSGTMNSGANDFLDVEGLLEINSSGVTNVNLSALEGGTFEAGMAWNLWDATQVSSTDASLYSLNFQNLDTHLASLGLTLDTSHFANHGILAIAAVVPEPSRAAFGMLAMLGLAMRRRR